MILYTYDVMFDTATNVLEPKKYPKYVRNTFSSHLH